MVSELPGGVDAPAYDLTFAGRVGAAEAVAAIRPVGEESKRIPIWLEEDLLQFVSHPMHDVELQERILEWYEVGSRKHLEPFSGAVRPTVEPNRIRRDLEWHTGHLLFHDLRRESGA